jgi:ElaB/YqjD/DUF883 family membrane-anchored ribosome-binding protein
MSAFELIPEHFFVFPGLIMESKSNPSFPSGKTPNESLNASHEPRALATVASSEIRKDVERATGKFAEATKETKEQVGGEVQEVKGELIEGGVDAKEAISRVADKVKQYSDKTIEATSTYATYAVDATGQKVRQVQSQIDSAKGTVSDYIHEDPVRAVTYTAIGTAVLTAALIGIFRRR